jgi:hypothetical protein
MPSFCSIPIQPDLALLARMGHLNNLVRQLAVADEWNCRVLLAPSLYSELFRRSEHSEIKRDLLASAENL